MKKFLIILSVLCSQILPAFAVTIEGVSVPPQVQVAGQTLQLNGAGLRTFKLLMVPIKVYVAAFYTPSPVRTVAAVNASPGPMEFDFTFLRAVGQSDVTQAWNSQFAHSVTSTYPGYSQDLKAFVGMFGPLAQGGVESVRFVGEDTVVIDQGVNKGVIHGENFQKTFLSLWFGSKPVGKKLRAALLGN